MQLTRLFSNELLFLIIIIITDFEEEEEAAPIAVQNEIVVHNINVNNNASELNY